MTSSPMTDDGGPSGYEALLRQVGVLYKCYEAGRREPFNLFSVLRKPSDEEHLHTKFLEALLKWKSPGNDAEAGATENLRDFVEQVVAPAVDTAREESEREEAESRAAREEPYPPLEDAAPPPALSVDSHERRDADTGEGDSHRGGFVGGGRFWFPLDDAKVERERHDIDLLIKNAKGQAIVIENKIWAGDQPEQLQRYFQDEKGRGFDPTLVYLTLDGHPPTQQSIGCRPVVCLSYQGDLIPWLRKCQERACTEPALRESVAQYIALILTLCGDSGREFMTEVKKILREGNNLILAGQLGSAATEVWRDLLLEYWNGVRDEVESATGVRDHRKLEDMLHKFLHGQGRGSLSWFHYAWPLSGWASASLKIEARRHEGFFYGVSCHRKWNREEYDRLKSRLSSSEYGDADSSWPGRKFFSVKGESVWRPSEKALAVLRNPKKRNEVVGDLIQLWKDLREPGPPN